MYCEQAGRYVHLLEHIDGAHPEPSPDTYRKLGELTAALHGIRGYPHDTDFQPAPIVARELPAVADRMPFRGGCLELVAALPTFDGLPRSVVHGDIGPGNAIQRPDGRLVLIDLDDLGTGVRVLDVAFLLIQQFISEDCEYLQPQARAFFDAYLDRITLTPDEQDHVFGAALLSALFYLVHGDTAKRWQRIQWAIAHRAQLESLYRR